MIRGAFEYQGQKCSAASRAYVPRSPVEGHRDDFLGKVENLSMGPGDRLQQLHGRRDRRPRVRRNSPVPSTGRTRTPTWMARGRHLRRQRGLLHPAHRRGETGSDQRVLHRRFFGPLLGVYVYDDRRYSTVMDQMEASPSTH